MLFYLIALKLDQVPVGNVSSETPMHNRSVEPLIIVHAMSL